jgi:hypothetical protein
VPSHRRSAEQTEVTETALRLQTEGQIDNEAASARGEVSLGEINIAS